MRAHLRRHSPRLLVGAALTLLSAGCGEPARPGVPPANVLLVTVEALRADHCSGFGYPRATTFVQRATDERALDIDRLAETGVSFARAFAPSPQARTSLRSLMRSRVPVDASAEAEPAPALADRFEAAGFSCAALLVPSESLAGEARAAGFERVEEFLADAGSPEPERAAFDAAREFVAARVAAGERFLLWIHLGRPAPPFDSPPMADEYSQPEGDARQRALDAYDGELERTNALLCGLLESLQALDGAPLDATVIALCGLSGLALPPGVDGARLDEAHLHVPLLLRHPGSLTGRRMFAEVVELTDLAPTLYDWFGLDAVEALDGRSLLPLADTFVDHPFERRGALSVEGAAASLRDARWRLVLCEDGSELYDVERDPEQRHEVGAEHESTRERLEAELRARLGPGGGP